MDFIYELYQNDNFVIYLTIALVILIILFVVVLFLGKRDKKLEETRKLQKIELNGELKVANNLKLSYVSQNTDDLKGCLKTYIQGNKIDESIFKAMLSKMGFSKEEFDKSINEMSEGQKKKILIAKSISESANIYIWDEPLNYIDIITRMQIEEAIIKYKPTLIFVEHDETFIKKVATKTIYLNI